MGGVRTPKVETTSKVFIREWMAHQRFFVRAAAVFFKKIGKRSQELFTALKEVSRNASGSEYR
jgi:hypothetical protein